jgi:sarcosine oxidase subunit beta
MLRPPAEARPEPPHRGDKVVVCACEDVTEHDLDDAISRGFRDVESLKRYTGLGTGPCQGRSCLLACVQHLARTARPPEGGLAPFRSRPPLVPMRLAELSGLELPPPAPFRPPQGRSAPHPLRPSAPVPERAAVVIVGGGIMGLALAYQLARRGQDQIVVLERGYLLEGASGRNGGGVRAQWSTPTNIELARESLQLCDAFAQELGINVWFRRGGYLFLARQPKLARRLEAAQRLHEAHGLRTRLIGPSEARDLVPGLNPEGIAAATFNPDDGVVFPWPFVWGYAEGARRRGVRIEPFTRVVGIEVVGGQVRSIATDRGRILTRTAVVAAGAWSPEVARLAGVALPNVPYRHEICTCEPLKPFVNPLVAELDSGLYFSQSARGELVGGMGDPQEPPGANQASSLRFLGRYSRAMLRLMPHLGAVKVVRQWAGLYDVTPDRAPILGETPGVGGLLQMSGFVGHGFMMAPAVARRMAGWMGGEKDELFTRFSLRRFAEGRLEPEGLIIG